jgi:peptide/nickel transport system substrate-binding protein
MRRKRVLALTALLALPALVLAACGSSNKSSSATQVPKGGTLVVGAEQGFDCADWIATCAGSAWGLWSMQQFTVPRVFDFKKVNGTWTNVPNILLTKMPTVSTVNGKQTITYNINPAAKWSDGQPITSRDFAYTWQQIVNSQGIIDTTGYSNIAGINTSDPHTAVVTFSSPFASWSQLFGSGFGVLPSHILQGKNRDALMANGYTWSGGPWLAHWDKASGDVTLTPNPNWYGHKPNLDKVVFRVQNDTAAEFRNFKSGQLKAIYPQPEPDAVDQIKSGVSDTNAVYSAETGGLEALWTNNARFPLDSKAVRQAIGYSLDRDAIVNSLFGTLGVTKATQTLNPPIVSQFSDTTAFSGYEKNQKKVDTLMKGDGWTKNGSGYWEKGGKEADITLRTTSGDQRREDTQQIIQQQLKTAGFKITIANQKPDDLFGTSVPNGDFGMFVGSQQATSLDPGNCSNFCSSNIPTAANGYSGSNVTRTNISALDPLLQMVDTSFDNSIRAASNKQADQLEAANMVSLPLDSLPDIALWNKSVVGPIGDNPLLSMFWNLDQWGLKK